MMLATGALRVVLVTTHLPLRDVPAAVTTERTVRIGRITVTGLQQWWGSPSTARAVRAQSPRRGIRTIRRRGRARAPAGSGGAGRGGPAACGHGVRAGAPREFDAVLAPYHDVGMTAIKVAGFGKGVNVTLGLPFPRVAPDHGTAFDIAGTGVADAGSMRAALELGVELAGKSTATLGR